MRESEIQKQIIGYLDELEQAGLVYFFRSSAGRIRKSGGYFTTGRPGCPDITACVQGRFVGLEVKTKTGKQSSDQQQAERDIVSAGGSYFVVRSMEEAKGVVEAALNSTAQQGK